jgi:hypothetical protein
MENLSPMQILTTEEVTARASKWAQELILRLDEHSDKYREAQLSDEESEYFRNLSLDRIPGPYPKDFRLLFESLFCRYLAARFIIVD